MESHDISIATMTWSRDAQEEALLREALTALSQFDIPVYITDGGSGKNFTEFLRGFSSFRVYAAHAPGVWPQVRQSMQAAGALTAKFVLYTEPDKAEFFRHGLPEFISLAPGDDEVGAVLASRSPKSFATFPAFQRDTEEAINRCCAEAVGAFYDFSYGPFVLNKKLVPHLYRAADDLGWGWRQYAFVAARRLGYRIVCVEKDLPCPIEQRTDSPAERLYRMSQLSQSIRGLLQAAADFPSVT